MDIQFEEKYHQLEKEMWWFRSRRNMVISMLGLNHEAKIIDIGCSGGALLEELANEGYPKENLYGIDISEKAIEICHKKGFVNCVTLDGANVTLQKNSFDIVIASDCLEHIEQDGEALESWFHLLKPEGIAIIFVPAFMFLWSGHDEINHHFRRYTKTELSDKMKKAGFKIDKSGYWNSLLFLPAASVRLGKKALFGKDKVKAGDDLKQPPALINTALTKLLFFENKLHKVMPFPFGVSVFAVGRK
jgi:SAM-dependent methyltransferase